jgi:hypothetical protein
MLPCPPRPGDFATGSNAAGKEFLVTGGTLLNKTYRCTAPKGSDVIGTHVLTFV